MKKIFLYSIAVSGLLSLFSCEKASDISYPYEEHGIVYMGIKSGLTSSSSDQAFNAGLNEVMQEYAAKNPGSLEFTFDGVKYEITNLVETTGGIPDRIWDLFWEDIDSYYYSADTGSCWGFSYVQIPNRKRTGDAMVIYAIVKSEGLIRYVAVRGSVTPK